MRAVYDQVADEYDQLTDLRDPHTHQVIDMALALAGTRRGLCVDIGCGTGAISGAFTDAGWYVVGMDLSREEIRIATDHKRVCGGLVGDAGRLPLRPNVADLVVSTYTHTDFPDWGQVVRGGSDVLRRGGRFIYIGMHPAFVGPHAQRTAGKTVIHSGYYRNPVRRFDGPGLTPGGWRQRVGVRQRTVADLLNAFPQAGLTIEEVSEGADGGPAGGGADVPWLIGVRAVRF